MRWFLYALPGLAFAALIVWVAIPLVRGDDPSDLPSALIDQAAPATDLPGLPGRGPGFTTADLGGEVMLVNVFASWCVPCLAEHPVLTRLAAEEGLTIHAINYRDAPDDALAWLGRHGDPFARIGSDPEGRAGIDWGITGVPETFVIDAAGRVRFRFAGPVMPEIAAERILPLVEALR